MQKKILFFDGVCVLCNSAVDFIMKNDHKNQFYFAPLQGETAKNLLPSSFTEKKQFESLYYLDESSKIHSKFAAVRAICFELYPSKFLALLLRMIPLFLGDIFYSLVAKSRYKLFGIRQTCRMPSEEDKNRILE